MNNTIIVYRPGITPQKICTTHVAKTANSLCSGFEIVRIRTLWDILPNGVFICSENFNQLENKKTNFVATMLYDNDYDILGTICIAKEIYTPEGNELVALSDVEANTIIARIRELMKIYTSSRGNYEKNVRKNEGYAIQTNSNASNGNKS